jgi:hypothetical protein
VAVFPSKWTAIAVVLIEALLDVAVAARTYLQGQ